MHQLAKPNMQSKIEATKTADQPANFEADLWKMKRRTWNPVKDLMWNLLQKIINGWNSLTIFARNPIWRPATLLKRDSGTGVFLWILRNFSEIHLFWRTSLVAAFVLWGIVAAVVNNWRFMTQEYLRPFQIYMMELFLRK